MSAPLPKMAAAYEQDAAGHDGRLNGRAPLERGKTRFTCANTRRCKTKGPARDTVLGARRAALESHGFVEYQGKLFCWKCAAGLGLRNRTER